MSTHEDDLTAVAEAVGVLITQQTSDSNDHNLPSH